MRHGKLYLTVTVSIECFKPFLNTYLRIFYYSFSPKKVKKWAMKNIWITPGIKSSCKCKKELYLASGNSNDPNVKNYYKYYCKIL
jgi:hypothetical protein